MHQKRKSPFLANPAAASPSGATSAAINKLSLRTPVAVREDQKSILQGIAHGGEGYGSEYGSGPSAANADVDKDATFRGPGDSASPAASAMSTRDKGSKRSR
jgi:hypothetical protein